MIKVRSSMARLLTVVNERKKLRGEYRRHLEDQYIAERKAEEKKQYEEEILEMRKQGMKTPMLEHEVSAMLKKKSSSKKEKLAKEL